MKQVLPALITSIVLTFASCPAALASESTEPRKAEKYVYVSGTTFPKAVPWTPKLTLMEAINASGGYSFREPKYVTIIRGAEHIVIELRAINLRPALDPLLQPGDKIETRRLQKE